jgi:hypothetical protein
MKINLNYFFVICIYLNERVFIKKTMTTSVVDVVFNSTWLERIEGALLLLVCMLFVLVYIMVYDEDKPIIYTCLGYGLFIGGTTLVIGGISYVVCNV